MHDAAFQGDYDIVKYLLEKGGDPLAFNEAETTAVRSADAIILTYLNSGTLQCSMVTSRWFNYFWIMVWMLK